MAQCTGTGAAAALGAAPFNIAGIAQGAAVSSLISSINTLNTAFLTQSTAFVGAPGNPRPNQEGGGIWARGIGGEIDTKNTTTSTYTIGGVAAVRQHHLQHRIQSAVRGRAGRNRHGDAELERLEHPYRLDGRLCRRQGA